MSLAGYEHCPTCGQLLHEREEKKTEGGDDMCDTGFLRCPDCNALVKEVEEPMGVYQFYFCKRCRKHWVLNTRNGEWKNWKTESRKRGKKKRARGGKK